MRSRAVGLVLAVLLLTNGLSGCGKRLTTVSNEDLVPIYWVSAWGLERAAAIVPCQIAGVAAGMQLDTGAQTCVPRAMLDLLGVAYRLGDSRVGFNGWADAQVAIVSELRFGSIARRDFPLVVYGPVLSETLRQDLRQQIQKWETDYPDAPPKVGNLGADFFAGMCLYLDFGTNRAGILDGGTEIAGSSCRFSWVSGRPVLALRGRVDLNAMYDTGSSPFTLLLRPGAFSTLTGLTQTGEGVETITVQSWGNDITIYSAEFSLELQADDVTLRVHRVYAGDLVERTYSDTDGRVDALLGNEAFSGRRLLINFARRTFTVADGAAK